MRITGIQFQAWTSAPQMVEYAREASRRFETIWLTDQFQSRSVSTLLGAIAASVECSVATGVTFPFGRNPIETASTMATLAELVRPPHKAVLGLGTGGALVDALVEKKQPIGRVREVVMLARALWAGETVELDEYPLSSAAGGFREGAKVALSIDTRPAIDVIVTGTGPQIMALAGEHGDGVLCASNFPSHSLAAFKSGQFHAISNLDAVERGRQKSTRTDFRRIYGINVSVSADRDAARAAARRQAALIIGQQPEPVLIAAGFDLDACRGARAAFCEGAGVAGAAERLPQAIADALVISGTPDDCIAGVAELLRFANDAGFTEAYIGAPVGPRPAEAIQLLTDIVLPELINA